MTNTIEELMRELQEVRDKRDRLSGTNYWPASYYALDEEYERKEYEIMQKIGQLKKVR